MSAPSLAWVNTYGGLYREYAVMIEVLLQKDYLRISVDMWHENLSIVATVYGVHPFTTLGGKV